MAWITISEDDVKAAISDSERRALDEIDLSNGQTSPIPEAITSVTAEIRGYVKGCKQNILTVDTTKIPDSLKGTALILIRYQLATRLSASEFFLNEDRIREWEGAYQRLRDVANCRFDVEAGDAESCSISVSYDRTSTPYQFVATSSAGAFGSYKRMDF